MLSGIVLLLLFTSSFYQSVLVQSRVNGDDYTSLFLSLQCDELVDVGFKNFVFGVKAKSLNDDLVLRIGFSSSSPHVVQIPKKDWQDFSLILSQLSANLTNSNNAGNSAVRHYLDCLLQTDISRSSSDRFDIASNSDIFDEIYASVRSASIPGSVFGTSISLFKTTFPLGITFQNGHELSLVVEYNRRVHGNLGSINDMTLAQIVEFLYGYGHDQLNFLKQTGRIHYDAHVRNILVDKSENKFDLLWSDFGKTSSNSDKARQYKNSLVSVYVFVANQLKSKTEKEEELVSIIERYVLNNNANGFEEGLKQYMNQLQSFIFKYYSKDDMMDFVMKISPSSLFAFQYMNQRIDNLEAKMRYEKVKFEKEIAKLISRISELESKVERLLSLLSQQQLYINGTEN